MGVPFGAGFFFLLNQFRWWTPGYNRTVAEGENIISCYVTAEKAEFMDGIDPQEALDIGLKELSELLGSMLLFWRSRGQFGIFYARA
jgi:hypothetical protein